MDVDRRKFITLIGGAAAAVPLNALAQAAGERRVGVLLPLAESDQQARSEVVAFRDRLRQLGWTEGRNMQIHTRWAAGDVGRMQTYAKELVALLPDVILARTTPVTAALLRETRTIPIVFVGASDPVGDGFAESMARPGGNATGFTNVEASMGGKWVEILKEINPRITQIAVMFDPKTSPGGGSYYLNLIQVAAGFIAVESISTPIQDAAEIERFIETFAREPNRGLLVLPDVTTHSNRSRIISLTARHRLPAVYGFPFYVTEGGLASYGVDVYRQAASYVDRILRGEKAGELAVQAPTKFELSVNLKTARALAITIPPTLLTRADKVIE